MTTFQKIIKYLAMAFAIFLIVSIIGGILGTVGIFAGISKTNSVSTDVKSYSVSQDITKLQVQVNAADFKIVTADELYVESNLKYITVKEDDGVLKITEKKRFGINYNSAVLTLGIPEDAVFERAEIITGAGKLTVDALSADTLDLQLGAGEVNIDKLNAAKKSQIDGGAGKLVISDGILNNLDLDMGVGELNFTAGVFGDSELNCGIGETKVTLAGDADDYRLSIDKGIGNVTVSGESVSGGTVYGNGENRVDIDCGIGSVKVKFTE